MALKGRMSRTITHVGFLALDLSLLFYLGFPSPQGYISSRRPTFADSPQLVQTSPAGVVSLVHIDDLLEFPVIQQPGGKPNYVSKNLGELTQFSSASQYGNIGLLAHNYLSGRYFFRLALGQAIHVQYSDGTREEFIVTEILRYEALEPKSPFSSFRNLNNKDEILSASQMFERAYGGGYRVTLQTCIAKYGNASWGRIFIVATPKAVTTAAVH